MKSSYFTLLLFIIITWSCAAQEDLQWVIKHGLGKKGIQISGRDTLNNFSNTINSNLFQFESIIHPNRNNHHLSKNDLFIIFDNWDHINTREKNVSQYDSVKDIFYPYVSRGVNPNDKSHNFRINYTPGQPPLKPNYLYLTNVYEGDDPPELVAASGGHTSNSTGVYNIDNSGTTAILTANHNVAYKKDITLILNRKGLKNSDFLDIGTIIAYDQNGKHKLSGQFFQPSDIFEINGSACYSNLPNLCASSFSNLLSLNGISTLPSSVQYVYINLRPTSAIDPFLPGNGYTKAEASFSIVQDDSTSSPESTIANNELILWSHDPNGLFVDSVCTNKSGNQIVYYSLQFYNDGSLTPSDVYVTFSVPDYMNSYCISNAQLFASGKNHLAESIDVGCFNGKVKIRFQRPVSLNPCSENDPLSCIGEIKFCMTVDKTYDIRDCQNSLQLLDPIVYFDNNPTVISEFHDMSIDREGCKRHLSENCDCKCIYIKCTIIKMAIAFGLLLLLAGGIWYFRSKARFGSIN